MKIHREHMGKDYDPATEYREIEEDTDRNQRDFDEAWGKFAADWPERATLELRERVHAVEGEPLGRWKGELLAEIAELARVAR